MLSTTSNSGNFFHEVDRPAAVAQTTVRNVIQLKHLWSKGRKVLRLFVVYK